MLLAGLVVVLFCYAFYKYSAESPNPYPNPLIDSLSFFKKTNICTEIMADFKTYKMTPTYDKLFPTMTEEQQKVKDRNEEGYSAQVDSEVIMLHHIARQPSVKTICETGFNYGHSSFNFLAANPSAQVYSFDLGNHGYARKMNKTLHHIFPDKRLHVTFGNSVITVPKAIAWGFLPRCDVVFVDGGHVYHVAKSDIYNLAMHTNEKNLIIFDDHPTSWGGSFGKAWDQVLSGSTLQEGDKIDYGKIKSEIRSINVDEKTGEKRRFAIKELMRCSNRKSKLIYYQRGFVVGTVIKV